MGESTATFPSMNGRSLQERAPGPNTFGELMTLAIGQYANVWHGHDHLVADSSDGYMYTSPVGVLSLTGLGCMMDMEMCLSFVKDT